METSLDKNGYARPIVKFQPTQGEKKLNTSLIRTVFAQEQDPNFIEQRNFVTFDLSEQANLGRGVRKIGDNLYEVTDETSTMVAVAFNKDNLAKYAGFLEAKRLLFPTGGTSQLEQAQRVASILEKAEVSFPVQTIRIVPQFGDTKYKIDPGIVYGFDPKTGAPKIDAASLEVQSQKVYRVEIKGATAADTIAFLERQHAVSVAQNAAKVEAVASSGWTELDLKGEGGIYTFDPPHRSVCCRGPKVPTEVSSVETPPAPVTIRDVQNQDRAYTYNPFRNEIKIDPSPFQNFRQTNPGLEFTQTDGKKVSMLDIDPPYPDDAPADFLGKFFSSGSEAKTQYKAGDPVYQDKWNDYLSMTMYNAKLAGQSPTDIRNGLINKLGLNSSYRQNRGQNPSGSTPPSTIDWKTLEDLLGGPVAPPPDEKSDSSTEGDAGSKLNPPPNIRGGTGVPGAVMSR